MYEIINKATAAAIFIALAFSGSVYAQNGNAYGKELVNICHVEGDDELRLISVALPAVDAHYDHGDLPEFSIIDQTAHLHYRRPGRFGAESVCPARCDQINGEWTGAWVSTIHRRPPRGRAGSCECSVRNCE